ncbi:RNA-binding protein [Novymonas esmeraldas]|uniref:RNA-binding protein n=1 Tax=Novymonas esmeraldas TaxID=1808958 RepID=A0AAW0EQJ6_9TRYP
MDGRLVQTSCRTAQFAAVEATLREWAAVEAVGSFREKSNNKRDITTVFVTFSDEAAARAATEKLNAIPGIAEAATVVSASSEQQQQQQQQQPAAAEGAEGPRGSTRASRKAAAGKEKKKLAAELLSFSTHEEQRQRDARDVKRAVGTAPDGEAAAAAEGASRGRAGRGGTGRGGRGASRGRGRGGNRGGDHAGHGAGGQLRGGRGRGRGGSQQEHQQQQQHQPQQQPPLLPPSQEQPNFFQPPPPPQFYAPPYQARPRLPPFEANVAFIDNVPFGTTNTYLMERFSVYGRILDVNRLELMVMICFDNPESVQQCIQHSNGTKIQGNVITVSSGTVRIPGSIAIQMGV